MNNSYTNRPRRGTFLYRRNVKKLVIVLVIILCGAWAVFPLFEYHASYTMGKYAPGKVLRLGFTRNIALMNAF